MNVYESLSLLDRFEATHSPLPDASRLVRKFSSIIRILSSLMNRIWDQFSMGYAVAFQLVCHDLSRLMPMCLQQSLEEFLSRYAVTSTLHKHTDGLPVLVDGSPQIVLSTLYLDKYLIDSEPIAETSVTTLHSSRIVGPKFIAA